ncbi:MAG: sodium-translocating pyrophosphatase, partial [Planctomycetota bacterium]|nr:sodium-translocating pyrophosphatase [Planctomycetota bacterium]
MYYLWNILSFLIAIASIGYAYHLFTQIMRKDPGDEAMQKIARAIQEGARAFLRAEYRWLAVFVVVVFVLLCFGKESDGLGWKTGFAFVLGSVSSAGAGYFGMHCATRAAVRTTQAAKTSLGGALDIAFKSGTVMGMTVVGIGLVGITVLMLVYRQEGVNFVNYVLGYSFGASSIALFARVGGGIFTKAADVGGDLVGKLEAGIPEDDPRNPAVIADNVGDNVGDVAGMGADLFESYVGAIISTAVLGWSLLPTTLTGDAAVDMRTSLLLYPVVLSAVGIIASFLGTFRVKAEDESKLSSALFGGLVASSVFLIIGGAIVTQLMQPGPARSMTGGDPVGHWSVYFAMVIGLVVGVVIGKVTEYYTSEKMAPAQTIAQQSRTGAATNIIYGLATGMASTWIPTLLLAIAIFTCNELAGIYGICIAAVGMLSTLGISLGVDAYGPVADNAGGMAEMTHQPPEVRKRTDSLDATGNTTAAIGKGFAIGSAALTALALFAAFMQQANIVAIDVSNPTILAGLLIGAMLPYVFSAMAMNAVGRAAGDMIREVGRQFAEIPGLREGTARAEYAKCVDIS